MSDAAAAAMALKEYVSARRILLLCSRLHPSRPQVYIRLGHLHMTQNQHLQAVAVLLQAARLVGIHVGGGGDGFTPGLLAPGAVAELPPQHASVRAEHPAVESGAAVPLVVASSMSPLPPHAPPPLRPLLQELMQEQGPVSILGPMP